METLGLKEYFDANDMLHPDNMSLVIKDLQDKISELSDTCLKLNNENRDLTIQNVRLELELNNLKNTNEIRSMLIEILLTSKDGYLPSDVKEKLDALAKLN